MNKSAILQLLPPEVQADCRIGICDPNHIAQAEPVYDHCMNKWSARPDDIFPEAKSIIALLHATSISLDYSIESLACYLAEQLWISFAIRSQLIDEQGEVDPGRLAGIQSGPAADTYRKLVLLKEAAYFAGLGQYGRNTMLINDEFGSDIKLQALFVDTPLPFDSPVGGRMSPMCRDCDECIRHCPSAAIEANPPGRPPSIRLRRCLCFREDVREELWDEQDRIVISRIPRSFVCPLQNIHAFDDCRACQAFCPANQSHYIAGSTVSVSRDHKCWFETNP